MVRWSMEEGIATDLLGVNYKSGTPDDHFRFNLRFPAPISAAATGLPLLQHSCEQPTSRKPLTMRASLNRALVY